MATVHIRFNDEIRRFEAGISKKKKVKKNVYQDEVTGEKFSRIIGQNLTVKLSFNGYLNREHILFLDSLLYKRSDLLITIEFNNQLFRGWIPMMQNAEMEIVEEVNLRDENGLYKKAKFKSISFESYTYLEEMNLENQSLIEEDGNA